MRSSDDETDVREVNARVRVLVGCVLLGGLVAFALACAVFRLAADALSAMKGDRDVR